MITPTIGRVVWFFDGSSDQPQIALIAYVHSDTEVNLAVFNKNGIHLSYLNVLLKQDESEKVNPPYEWCEWMPFQKGQAAKTEALEAKLAG